MNEIVVGVDLSPSSRAALSWAAEHATAASTEVMRATSELGGTRYVVVVALAVTGVELLREYREQGAEDLLWVLINRLDFLFY